MVDRKLLGKYTCPCEVKHFVELVHKTLRTYIVQRSIFINIMYLDESSGWQQKLICYFSVVIISDIGYTNCVNDL